MSYALGFRKACWGRLPDTLRVHFDGAPIKSLPMGFVTGHQFVSTSGRRHDSAGTAGVRFDGVSFTKEARLEDGDIRVISTFQAESRRR